MKNAYSALMLGSILCTGNVWASNCVQMPDCQSLGYTKTENDCKGKPTVFCPTDKSKAFCSGTTEIAQEVAIGAILYADGTVTKDILSDKIPIGIVFDTEHRLAVALTDVKKDGSEGSQGIKWSENVYDVPNLENCTSITYGTDQNSDGTVETCGIDGRAGTNAILACGTGCGGTPAATACNLYQPTGCTQLFCQKGQWFLPSMRDLNNIYLQKAVINATLSSLGRGGLLEKALYWSSTEYSNRFAWYLYMGDGYKSNTGKFNTNNNTWYLYVRPVIAY